MSDTDAFLSRAICEEADGMKQGIYLSSELYIDTVVNCNMQIVDGIATMYIHFNAVIRLLILTLVFIPTTFQCVRWTIVLPVSRGGVTWSDTYGSLIYYKI